MSSLPDSPDLWRWAIRLDPAGVTIARSGHPIVGPTHDLDAILRTLEPSDPMTEDLAAFAATLLGRRGPASPREQAGFRHEASPPATGPADAQGARSIVLGDRDRPSAAEH